MEQLADIIASRCDVPVRFVRFILNADDPDENYSVQTVIDKTNFVKNATRVAAVGGIFPNEIQTASLAINNNVSLFVAKTVLITEQHSHSPLSRQERCTFLQKIMDLLDQEIIHILP